MAEVFKTRKIEFNPFCIENNVKRNNQLRKLKSGDLERSFSVGSVRRGGKKRENLKPKESRSTAGRQKEEVSAVSVLLHGSSEGLAHSCICTRRRAEQCTV